MIESLFQQSLQCIESQAIKKLTLKNKDVWLASIQKLIENDCEKDPEFFALLFIRNAVGLKDIHL